MLLPTNTFMTCIRKKILKGLWIKSGITGSLFIRPKVTQCGIFKSGSVHPEMAFFDPELCFRDFEILEIACYSCNFKITQALLRIKICLIRTDTNRTSNSICIVEMIYSLLNEWANKSGVVKKRNICCALSKVYVI